MLREIFEALVPKSQPAARLIQPGVEQLVEAVLKERPDLQGKPVRVPKQGMMSYVAIIGDEVFKAPTRPGTVVYYDQDFAMLQAAKDVDPAIPSVTCVGKKSVFFGMTCKRGVTLFSLPELSSEEKLALAKEVAAFIVRFALKTPQKNGLYAQNPDINGGNILVDPETKKMTGMIDFGDAYYGPLTELKSSIGQGIHDQGKHTEINDLVQAELKVLLTFQNRAAKKVDAGMRV